MDVKIGELEDLFERYRSGQDLRALSKLFDLAAPELLRLAVHMAPDVASAEDLVQQTFLAAIEKPKRWRAGEPLLPWLFGILAKLAKKQRRNARRTPEPDRLAARTPEDPARHTLDVETQSAIRSALEGLPELYREVVRASLFEEKPPHEIARELERAPGTVRMQLLRGLELLRRALPAGLAGGALVLCGTRGEAALKAVVLEKAAAAPVVLAASTLTLGGLFLSTKAVLATLVAVVGLCTWILWPGTEPTGAVEYASDQMGYPVRVVTDADGQKHLERLPVTAPGEARTAIEAPAVSAAVPAPAAGIFLVGRLLGVAPEHATEVELQVRITGRGEVRCNALRDGSFEMVLDSLREKHAMVPDMFGNPKLSTRVVPATPGESSELDIWVRHSRYISEHEVVVAKDLFAALAAGERREVRRDIQFRPAAIVSGRVRVPAGWNVREANVKLELRTLDPADVLGLTEEHSNCDAEGSYSVKSLRRGELLVRAELPGLLPTAVYATVEPGRVLALPDLVLEEGACTIRGRVDLPESLRADEVRVDAVRADSLGEGPVAGALGGSVLDERGAASVREIRGGCSVSRQSARVDATGAFSLRGLEPGRWELSLGGLRASATLPLFDKACVLAPAEGVVLGEQLGSIAFLVRDSKGPVGSASLTVGDGETFLTLVTGGDGRVQLVGDLRKDYTASAGAPVRDKASLALPAIGRAREASFELRLSDPPRPATLVFRPKDASRAPRAVQLRLRPAEEGSELTERNEKLELANGHFELDGVLPGHWKMMIGPAEEQMPVAFFGGYMQSERFDATLVPGDRFERELRCEGGGRLRIDVEASASLKSNGLGCKLASLDGKAVDDPLFVSSVSGEGFGIFGSDEHLMIMGEHTQVALQDCLPPGRYELRIPSDAVHAKPLVFEIKLGETTQATWKIEK